MTTNARTDPETGLRFYTWQGHDYPSVTSIRRLIGMPFTLHNWALSQVIERAVSEHDKIGDMLARPRRARERAHQANIRKEVKQYLRKAATEERDAAGDRGTRAHEAIAAGLAPDTVDPDIRGPVTQFHDFMATQKATILFSERQVWNPSYGYAGTMDVLLRLADGRICVCDYKSSKGVYIDHAIQCMAYSMCEFVGENDRMDAVATNLLAHAEAMAILHLSDTSWEFIELNPNTTLFQAFVGSLAFATFLHANSNSIDPLVSHRTTGGTLVPVLQASIEAVESEKEAHA